MYPNAKLICSHRDRAHINLLGHLNTQVTRDQIKGARFLVFPSRWYEPFGMALLEAAACGVPAIAARIGGVPELVIDGKTGLLFDPESPDELADKADWAWTHPHDMAAMGRTARELYLKKYTAKTNYEQLMRDLPLTRSPVKLMPANFCCRAASMFNFLVVISNFISERGFLT